MKKKACLVAFIALTIIVLMLSGCGCEHEIVIDAAVPATCTQSGLTEGEHCAICDEVLVKQKQIPAKGHTEEIIAAVPASCTTNGSSEGKKCSECGEVFSEVEAIEALGHTTSTGTCDRCGQDFGLFEIGYYVDEFDQPTSEGYVVNKNYIVGKFSNSATTDSKLNVMILADGEDIAIFLYEYGSNQVKNASNRTVDEYKITMKTADGTKYEISGTMYCGGDRLIIDAKHYNIVLSALKSGEEVSFYLVQSDYTVSTYLFSINTSNFAEKYQEMFG